MTYKVVIIDDEPWTRQVIRKLGKWDEYDLRIVGEASDGLSGLDLVMQLKPDIILTDVKMPMVNGLELLRDLRAKKQHAKTIVISGYDNYDYIREALKLEVTDYLLKPIKPDELNQQLKKCIQQLNEEWHASSGSLYDACAFMTIRWLDEYDSIKDDLTNSLLAQNRSLVEQTLSHLHEVIKEHEGEDIPVKLLISFYYDLVHALEHYISERGYGIEQVFDGDPISFVFRQDVKMQEVVDFIQQLYMRASDRIKMLHDYKSKVDIVKIKEYVDANYKGDITLEKVANRFYLSKEYLSKLYKQHTGESFSAYVTRKRMQKAKSLIVDFDMAIKEVHRIVGYSDKAHFYKMFKKHFGMTPGELKNKEL